MYRTYAQQRYYKINGPIEYRSTLWYVTELRRKRNDDPIFRQLHRRSKAAWETNNISPIEAAIRDQKQWGDTVYPIAFSSLSPHAQSLIFRSLRSGSTCFISESDPWWTGINETTLEQLRQELYQIDGTAQGLNQLFSWSIFRNAREGNNVSMDVNCLSLVHWDSPENPLDYIADPPLWFDFDHTLTGKVALAPTMTPLNRPVSTQTADHSPQPNIPRCPTCSSTNIRKLQLKEKAVGFALFGVFSQRAQKQFHCNNCGYEW